MADKVLEAIRSLPEEQRTVTTLFYINGYSQRDIAEFLEVPVTTITNRLRASRIRLKERTVTMVDETLKENAPDERFAQEVKAKLLRSSYGLECIEGWRWVPAEPMNVARLRAEGQEFVARIYDPDTGTGRINFHVEFIEWLQTHGLGGETLVPTAAGKPYARLSNREAAMLLALDEGAFLPVPFEAADARAWGEFTGRLHTCCESWQPNERVGALLLQESPTELLDEACHLTAASSSGRAIMEQWAAAIASDCDRLIDAEDAQPVHGCLWPGTLLKGSSGLKVVDVRFSGFGPRAVDMANAFRWMYWRDDPTRAASLWGAWLAGYRECRTPSELELRSLPAVASLWNAYWLIDQVDMAMAENARKKDIRWYIDDHCTIIKAQMARRGALGE